MAFLVKTGSSRLSGEKNFKWTFCFFVPKEVLHAKGKTVLSLPIFLSAVCLAGAYLLCRFGLFSLHGMKQWPAVLAAAGFAALVAAALYDFRIASSTTVVCYPAGCFLGLWLGKTQTDPGGGQTHSGWIIWTIIFALGIFFGFLTDWILQKKKHIKTEAWFPIRPLFWYMAFLESD